ncbi:hypothetical protein D3C75_1254530 [compost metagenome]
MVAPVQLRREENILQLRRTVRANRVIVLIVVEVIEVQLLGEPHGARGLENRCPRRDEGIEQQTG